MQFREQQTHKYIYLSNCINCCMLITTELLYNVYFSSLCRHKAPLNMQIQVLYVIMFKFEFCKQSGLSSLKKSSTDLGNEDTGTRVYFGVHHNGIPSPWLVYLCCKTKCAYGYSLELLLRVKKCLMFMLFSSFFSKTGSAYPHCPLGIDLRLCCC